MSIKKNKRPARFEAEGIFIIIPFWIIWAWKDRKSLPVPVPGSGRLLGSLTSLQAAAAKALGRPPPGLLGSWAGSFSPACTSFSFHKHV